MKKFFISFIILGIILTPCSFDFPKINNLYAQTEIHCGETISQSATWTASNSPYIISGDHHLRILPGVVLTIEPGVIVKFSENGGLAVNGGEIIAKGTEEKPIIFTSNNGSSYPQPGGWSSIEVYNHGKITLNYAVVEYGGFIQHYERLDNKIFKPNTALAQDYYYDDFTGAITISGAQADINNSIIASSTIGLKVMDIGDPDYSGYPAYATSTVSIHNSKIYNNDRYGVFNGGASQVDAINNWWGDNSGPYHAVSNPQGQGDRIYGDVLFVPWIGKQEKKDPVIIVPGIMGSWEKYGEWVIDPVLHTYDNLIEAMVKSGYELNKTLFLFPYDWRANNVITASLLKDKIAEVKQKTNSGKVDIVAHSMGGLVSRYYAQSNEYNNDIDQLIFLGIPHQGSPRSYLTYEGGYIPGRLGSIMKYYLQVEAVKQGYFSLPQYIREQVASVEQLLPVYNYLQEKINNNWQFRLYPARYPRNTFLENLNIEPAIEILKQRADIANIYSSAGANSTLSAIKVVPDSNIYDSKWMDGYPENLEDGDLNCLVGGNGDGTVPTESLNFLPGVDVVEIADAGHREIVTQAQKDVIEILSGKRPADFYQNFWPVIKRILFIRVYSPVDFVIVAPGGEIIGKDFSANAEINQIKGAFYSGFDADAEFVTILNPQAGDYQIKLQGTDDGVYQLGVDILEENNLAEQPENIIAGIISAEEEEDFSFNCQEDNAAVNIIKEINFNSLIQDLNELYRDGEIKKEFIRKILNIQFRHLSKKYDKIEAKEKQPPKQTLNKQIIHSLEIIKKELKFYLAKDWITQTAYDVLINDIINIINKLK